MINLLFSPCRPQILLVKPRYKQLSCFHSFPKAGNDQLWWLHGRKVHGGLLFFFFFSPLNFVKWTKRIFIEKSCIFSSEGRSNTVCEMRVAWVWLFQKASACYCLPSQLLQAPAPWLPYMRDQGLPRCFWERRAQCETGQTSPQNTHFLCMLGALVGIQMGSLTQQLGLGFFVPPRCS